LSQVPWTIGFDSDVLSGSRLVPDDRNPTLFSIPGIFIVWAFALGAEMLSVIPNIIATKV
jgi:hypothetical protein